MTDEQIIKALECCMEGDCAGCPYSYIFRGCRDGLSADVINLIDRQKAEIEKLKDELADARYLNTVAADDAIKEFTERLKEIVQFTDDTYECWEIEGYIDDLVKEMTEGNENA